MKDKVIFSFIFTFLRLLENVNCAFGPHSISYGQCCSRTKSLRTEEKNTRYIKGPRDMMPLGLRSARTWRRRPCTCRNHKSWKSFLIELRDNWCTCPYSAQRGFNQIESAEFSVAYRPLSLYRQYSDITEQGMGNPEKRSERDRSDPFVVHVAWWLGVHAAAWHVPPTKPCYDTALPVWRPKKKKKERQIIMTAQIFSYCIQEKE